MDTVETVFSDLAKHIITGLMIHDQLNSYYLFLNLPKYAECHKKQYNEENNDYFLLKEHYITNHNQLIKNQVVANPNIIPPSWQNYSQIEVDTNTKRTAVHDGLKKWMEWEQDTKEFYEDAYIKLIDLNEVNDACFVKHLITKVSKELSQVTEWFIMKQDCDFNINIIIEDQK